MGREKLYIEKALYTALIVVTILSLLCGIFAARVHLAASFCFFTGDGGRTRTPARDVVMCRSVGEMRFCTGEICSM